MSSVFVSGLLAGRSALVTGGGSGIGAGLAIRLAEQGARVMLVGRKQEKLDAVQRQIVAAGGVAATKPCDVRDFARVEEAVAATVAAHGGLDILVNSAAGNFLAPAATLSANGFRTVIDIDLCGTFNFCRAAFGELSKARGAVVNITATQATVRPSCADTGTATHTSPARYSSLSVARPSRRIVASSASSAFASVIVWSV